MKKAARDKEVVAALDELSSDLQALIAAITALTTASATLTSVFRAWVYLNRTPDVSMSTPAVQATTRGRPRKKTT